MKESKNTVKTFVNPAGFIEQHYIGSPPPSAVLSGLKEIESIIKREKSKNSLILIDISKITKIDVSVRMLGPRIEAVKVMRNLAYKRAAIYGPVTIQVIVNTLAKVGGAKVRKKVRCFGSRAEALEWLKSKN